MKTTQRGKTARLWTVEKPRLETMATMHHIHYTKGAGLESTARPITIPIDSLCRDSLLQRSPRYVLLRKEFRANALQALR